MVAEQVAGLDQEVVEVESAPRALGRVVSPPRLARQPGEAEAELGGLAGGGLVPRQLLQGLLGRPSDHLELVLDRLVDLGGGPILGGPAPLDAGVLEGLLEQRIRVVPPFDGREGFPEGSLTLAHHWVRALVLGQEREAWLRGPEDPAQERRRGLLSPRSPSRSRRSRPPCGPPSRPGSRHAARQSGLRVRRGPARGRTRRPGR